MAAIDKIYVTSWEDYQEIAKWCKENKFTCPNGIVVDPSNYIYELKDPETFSSGKSIPIMNTPYVVDYFLIKYCPIKIIQDRMKEVYNKEYYESILNDTSAFDTFVRPESGTKITEIKNKCPYRHIRGYYNGILNKKIRGVYVTVIYGTEALWFNPQYDKFIFDQELGVGWSSDAYIKCKSLKAVLRRIKKWDIPKGAIVEVIGKYSDEHWVFRVS